MNFASSAEEGLGGKELLESHLWCPSDLVRSWDGLDYTSSRRDKN